MTKPNPTNSAPSDELVPVAPTDELEALKAKLEAAEREREEYLIQAKRARADFENYQKRVARDQAQERKYAVAPLAKDLLAPLDNLERATAAAQQAGDKGPLVQGVVMAQVQFLDVLRRHGITRIEALGQPLDTNLHEAVMQVPAAGQPPMTVVQVLESGYLLHDRLLRPARVAVAAPAESPSRK